MNISAHIYTEAFPQNPPKEDTCAKERSEFTSAVLSTTELIRQKEELAKVFAVAFPEIKTNLFTELNNNDLAKYTCLVIKDDAGQLEGFTLIEPFKDKKDTWYEAVTAVAHQNQGNVNPLLQARDAYLREHKVNYLITDITEGDKYHTKLKFKYKIQELEADELPPAYKRGAHSQVRIKLRL